MKGDHCETHDHRVDATVPGDVDDVRVDKYIAEVLALLSRSQMAARSAEIAVNGMPVKPSHRVRSGDTVSVAYNDPPFSELTPESVDLEILYEDGRVIVVNKPTGMVVHPAAGNWTGTLVQGLLYHVQGLREAFGGESVRPGIVHRLDKDTSGVLVAAKDPETLRFLADQFSSRDVRKTYLAVVKGRLRARSQVVKGRIERDPRQRKRFRFSDTHGKEAESEIRLLRQYRGYAFVAVTPHTGRTHQIRVHLHHLGCPILGDEIYSRRDGRFATAPLMLHSYRLSIGVPPDGSAMNFCAPLPDRFKEVLRDLSESSTPVGSA